MNEDDDTQVIEDTDAVVFERNALVVRDAIDVQARTVEVVLSSEEPYERWWGIEILSHDVTAVRLGRLNDGRHPWLVDHNTRDQVGVIVKAWLGDDRRLRCLVRFGKSARAEEIFNDIVDGIRTLVSVGYRIHDLVLARRTDDNDEYLITDWEPYEGSTVAIPADPSVGVGRDAKAQALIRSLITRAQARAQTRGITTTTRKETTVDEDDVKTQTKPAPKVEPQLRDMKAEREQATALERQRVRDISALGEKFNQREAASKAVEDGMSYDAFRESVFTGLEQSKKLKVADPGDIGLTGKEVQQFRFANLIAATLWPDDQTVRNLAGFEIACARAAADKRENARTERQGAFTIPVDVLGSALDVRAADADIAFKLFMQRTLAGGRIGQRDLVVGTPTAGGHLVATELLASSFIDLLVNQLSVMQMGATMLTDLQGNIAIPRATAGATGYWVAEGGAPTESQQAFDQVALTPKTMGAFVDYSRRLLLQSSIAVEAFIRMDIARSLSLMLDLGALTGSGSANQPRGLLNTSGIGSVAGGANGAAPTWDHIVDLETAVANSNAPVNNLGYLTNTKVRGKLKKTQQFSGTNGRAIWEGGELNGNRAVVSNQVPSNLTKGTATGVCSAIAYGNWSDMIIALWGGLDMMLDPYAMSTSGGRRVVALQDADVNVRYPVSFAAMQDALTT